MTAENQTIFLTKKIKELQTAILTQHSNSLLKLPSSVVNTLYIDETGCVWIAINKPSQCINQFESSFHVALSYYKKGKPFFLNTYGIARVVTDPEETNQFPLILKQQLDNGKLLICVRILEANYYENQYKIDDTFLKKIRHTLSNIFWRNNDYYALNFNENKNFA